MNYIRKHWLGQHSLACALFVNLVAVRLLILLADKYTLPPYIPDRSDAVIATAAFVVLCHGVIFSWQIIGLLRTTDRYAGGFNSNHWVWVAYMAILVSVAFTLFSIGGAVQGLTKEQFKVENPTALADARAEQYALSVSSDGTRVFVKGIFALGMTERLKKLLDQNPRVTDVVLSSDGGQVYEGRGGGHLIRTRQLNTYVYGVCKSACATMFIGGVVRAMGKDAKLGFHQYGVELKFPVPLYDVKEEQRKEIEFYRQQGVSEDFLGRVFDTPHSEIWFPAAEDLINSNVVHRIVGE